jgi:hypothetical protein
MLNPNLQAVSVEQRRFPELYDLKALKGKVPVPNGARAYQLQNFKVIGPDKVSAPVLHIEPLFFSVTYDATNANHIK